MSADQASPMEPVLPDDPYHTLQKQVDAIQALVVSQRKVWFKDVSTLISLIALALSITGALVSALHTRTQDIQGMRQDLRAVLERLVALPKESLELSIKYKGDESAKAQIGQILGQENAFLSRESADLGRRLPSKSISSAEFMAIATAQQNSYDYRAEEEFLQKAQEAANNFNDEIAADRVIANLHFMQGQPEQGRVGFQTALAIFDKYRNYDQFTITNTHITTELMWANAERWYVSLDAARPHVQAARSLLAALPPSQGQMQLKAEIEDANARIEMLPNAGASNGGTLAANPAIPQVPVPNLAASH